MESILRTIRKFVIGSEEDDHFDVELITHINSLFMILSQMGVGPPEGFVITDDLASWTDFIPESQNLELVKSYLPLKVKLLFDPPSSSAHMEALTRSIDECEWRLNHAAEIAKSDEKEG